MHEGCNMQWPMCRESTSATFVIRDAQGWLEGELLCPMLCGADEFIVRVRESSSLVYYFITYIKDHVSMQHT